MNHIKKMSKINSNIACLIELLRNKGIIFTKVLSDKEILDIEETFMFNLFTQYAINSKRCKFPSTFAPFTQIKTIFAFQNPERRKKWSK